MMNSNLLKTEGLCWLRYSKKMDIVATEVGYWSADILGLNDKIAIEVEVKVSKSDIRAEFRNKGPKHGYYKAAIATGVMPNYFYILVPAALVEFTVAVVNENNPKYGVLSFPDTDEGGVPGKKLTVIKKATKMHTKSPSINLQRALKMRMSSEICGLHQAVDRIHQNVSQQITSLFQGITDTVKATVVQLPEEEEDEALSNQNPI